MGKYKWSEDQEERRRLRRPNVKGGFYRLPKATKNTTAELKIYSVLEKDFLLDNPVCQCGRNGCERPSSEVHHKKGRGRWLNVVEFFLAVAGICHRWIEDHPKEAKALGLSVSRLNK